MRSQYMNKLKATLQDMLLEAMKEAGVTQADLAKRLGVSRQAVHLGFDTGWSLDRLEEVAAVMGMRWSIHTDVILRDGAGQWLGEAQVTNAKHR